MDSFYEDPKCLRERIELFRANLHFIVMTHRGDFSSSESIQLSQNLDELLVVYTRSMDSERK